MSFNAIKLLVIGHVWPEPQATAAGKHMMQLLEFFVEQGADITFASTAIRTEYSKDLSESGIKEESIELNNPSFDEFIRALNPDMVVFDRFMTEEQFGWRVAENAPNALRILNTEDLHSLRQVRAKRLDCDKSGEISDWIAADITKRELASIYRSDLSLIISGREMEILMEQANIDRSLLHYLPFIYGTIPIVDQVIDLKYSERSDFIFVGNGKHQPNIDAIRWLNSEIWPLIRKVLPEVRLHIYGAYLPESIRIMHNDANGFLVHGWVANSKLAVGRARVNLAPLQFGAGIKGKLLEAMSVGTPSMSTAIGWEGIANSDELHKGSADEATEFAQNAIDLYSKKSEWNESRKIQIGIYEMKFNHPDQLQLFQQRLTHLKENLGEHRAKNIVGNLLSHHTMAGTKYMAKWIEAKNQAGIN